MLLVSCHVMKNCLVLPVAGSSHRKTLGACLQWVQLTSHHPGDGTPGAGEEEDVDAHKGDGGALSGEIRCSGDGSSD
jgi:hypothetical protein